jgi:hypothetical protein
VPTSRTAFPRIVEEVRSLSVDRTLVGNEALAQAYDEIEEAVKFEVNDVSQCLWDAARLRRPSFPCP